MTAVCTLCKREDHPDYIPCQTDLESAIVLALGQTEGWQRCPGCHRLVELLHGCYHMTCLCRTQFCYLCAVLWKGCTCPQWDEARLTIAAENQVRIQHDIADDAVLNPRHQEAVRRRENQLRENHDCPHPRWRYQEGAARCESCYHRLNRFILVSPCILISARQLMRCFNDRDACGVKCLLVFDANEIDCNAYIHPLASILLIKQASLT